MSDSDSALQSSPLADEHARLGGRMVPFSGWLMPVQYTSIMEEHKAVRENCGVFDISHMGQFRIDGARAAAYLNRLLTNDVEKLQTGQGQYTLILNEGGGVIDDLIIYRTGESEYFLVVNAAKVAEDAEWLTSQITEEDGEIAFRDLSEGTGALAIQGPKSAEVFEKMIAGVESETELTLPPRNGILEAETSLGQLILCRTGYTGEDGFELFCPAEATPEWFRRAIEAGATPCGLGARDTLRLEKCYPLNGSDLNEHSTPMEAGLGFFVDLDKCDFVGRDVVEAQDKEGIVQRLVAIKMTGKSPPPRHGYGVYAPDGGAEIGVLTSGGLSPSLGIGIGMAYLPLSWIRPGTAVEVDVRGRRFPAEVVKKPFL